MQFGNEPFGSAREVAKFFGVHERTAYTWRDMPGWPNPATPASVAEFLERRGMNSAPSKIAASVAQFDRHAASFQANHLEPLLSRLRSLHAAADELHPEAARQCRAVVDEQAALAIFLLAELMADPLTAADYARGRSDGGAWPEVVDTSYGSKIATYTSGSGAVR